MAKESEITVPRIICDNREAGSVVSALQALGAVTSLEVLPVGDFVLSERVVVERKTRNDFEASIIDGRLFEQARRLSEAYACVIFVVEGASFEERVKRSALLGAFSALLTDFGASVFLTRDEAGTAELLFAIARREQCGEKRELRLLGAKKAHSLSDYQQLLVECLPNVGPVLAKQLLRHFGSIDQLAQATEEELCAVEGVGEKKAKEIVNVFTRRWRASR